MLARCLIPDAFGSLAHVDPERTQSRLRQPRFVRGGILVYHVLQLDDGLGLLAELELRVALLEEGRGGLVALGPLLQ